MGSGVKIVRESMNQTLELWKEIPGHLDEVLASPQLNGSSSTKVCLAIDYLANVLGDLG
ncbi:hypothetical protein HanOQP8_Chr17g0682771 [Helianthus annuus]|nr:hypothetical protein HanOQP8_Chr17g0682771 [Helianthus annuus]